MFKRGRKIGMALTVALCMVIVYCMSALSFVYARTTTNETIDTGADVSLTLKYPVDGAKFSLYKIATVDAKGKFTKTEQFEVANVKIEGDMTENDWRLSAEAFARYILDYNAEKPDQTVTTPISPLMTGTVQNNQLTFEGEVMTTGLYLVTGEKTVIGYDEYTPSSFLMALPNASVDQDGNNILDYDVIVEVKYEHINTSVPAPDPTPTPDPDPTPTPDPDPTPEPETESVTVIKNWNDEGNEAARPESIHVNLYNGDTFIGNVELNADNNWRYTWTGMQAGGDWIVVETGVTSPYTVTYEESETGLLIHNTYTEEIGENDTPQGSFDPDDDDPGTEPSTETPGEEIDENDTPHGSFNPGDSSDTPESSGGSTPTVQITDNETPLSRLPQTGLLQWPIPILGMAGLGLFAFGWFDYNKKKREQDHEE